MDEFTLLSDFKKNDSKRKSFNLLVSHNFHMSFEKWYQYGYWGEQFIPYTLFIHDTAIANIAVNLMDFSIFNSHKKLIQLGFVMTHNKYRHKGLIHFLIDKVKSDWSKQCDLMYLYANDSVLNFYPKFGFAQANEFEYSQQITHHSNTLLSKIDIHDKKSRDKLYHYLKYGKHFGKISMAGNENLVMFCCLTTFQNHIYYIKSLDTIVIFNINNSVLNLIDIFSYTTVELQDVINAIANKDITTVTLGFTPSTPDLYQMKMIDPRKTNEFLHIQLGKEDLFQKNKIMFPLLSRA